MLEVGDRVQIHNPPNEWGSGIVAGILEYGALVAIDNGVDKEFHYFYFNELEKINRYFERRN